MQKKTIQVDKIVYESKDGLQFNTSTECRLHEYRKTLTLLYLVIPMDSRMPRDRCELFSTYNLAQDSLKRVTKIDNYIIKKIYVDEIIR